MRRSIPRWQTAGFLFVSVLGTFLHFLFDLTGGSPLAACISAVNESIWEHLKLLYVPMVIFALLEYFFWGRDQKNFWPIKLRGILAALALIPVLYYTYTGIFGRNVDWLNIALFFLVAALVYYLETRWFSHPPLWLLPRWAAVILIAILGILFVTLTFRTPHIPLFQDPATTLYGFSP